MSEIAATDLRVVMEGIASVYTFVPEKYPALKGMTLNQQSEFAIDHSIKHMAKTLGKIAAESESRDHGGPERLPTLKLEATKMVITSLNLAHMLGMSAQQLVDLIQKEVK